MSDTDAPDVKGALGKRIGPLPVAGWLAAIGGGLAISWYLRRNGSGATSSTAADSSGEDTGGTTSGTGGAAYSSAGNPGNISDPTSSDNADLPEPVSIETNAQWRQQAVKWLIGNGTTAINAERYVGAYLAGTPLSESAVNAINKVEAAIGPPPVAVSITLAPNVVHQSNPTTTTHGYTTNAAWRAAAITWLVHHGRNRANAEVTTTNYLHGWGLGPQAVDSIHAVVGAIGDAPHHPPIRHAAHTVQHHQAPGNSRRDTGTNTNP
jgi:hypothetical protein